MSTSFACTHEAERGIKPSCNSNMSASVAFTLSKVPKFNSTMLIATGVKWAHDP